jgi:hypothetical protein
MNENNECPRCGYPASSQLVESLTREVNALRETVARLRGASSARSVVLPRDGHRAPKPS